ncbi:hypothetical protein E2C01_027585 [Portunus trituberculatus]|uniref:Uncharacterized protein n=1 Tax=Portunus trituberculatus TaxID=210409 RepID=A0A5B7EP38_PORTR|nr:hypothetical protein [Portunus trituberculatus]
MGAVPLTTHPELAPTRPLNRRGYGTRDVTSGQRAAACRSSVSRPARQWRPRGTVQWQDKRRASPSVFAGGRSPTELATKVPERLRQADQRRVSPACVLITLHNTSCAPHPRILRSRLTDCCDYLIEKMSYSWNRAVATFPGQGGDFNGVCD